MCHDSSGLFYMDIKCFLLLLLKLSCICHLNFLSFKTEIFVKLDIFFYIDLISIMSCLPCLQNTWSFKEYFLNYCDGTFHLTCANLFHGILILLNKKIKLGGVVSMRGTEKIVLYWKMLLIKALSLERCTNFIE